MSRLNKKTCYSDSDSETTQHTSRQKELAQTPTTFTKSDSQQSFHFARPKSGVNKPNLYLESSEEDFAKKTPATESSTSITAKLKKAVKNSLSKITSSSKKNKSNPKKTNKSDTDDDTNQSRTRTPSTERHAKPDQSFERTIDSNHRRQSSGSIRKTSHFSRPVSQLETDSDTEVSLTENPKSAKFKSSSDEMTSVSPSPSDHNVKKKISLNSSKKSSLQNRSSSSESSYSSSSVIPEKNMKLVVESEDEEDDDNDSEPFKHPIRVKIENKPPIDKSRSRKLNSSLEKPNPSDHTDSDDSNNNGRVKSKNTHKIVNINLKDSRNQIIEIEQDSSNEMTDVSPLATPKVQNSKLDMSVFYKALDQDLNMRMDQVFNNFSTKITKKPPVKAQTSVMNQEFSSSYTTQVHNSIDFEYQSAGKLMEAENKKLYKKSNSYTASKPFRITSSALNRQREQQRIERENQVID